MLTPKKRKTIEALLTLPSITQAADAAGVSRRSIHRWMREEDFVTELNRAEDSAYAEMRRTLAAGRTIAMRTLLEMMGSGSSESVRLRAALGWLDLYLKLHDLGLEARVLRLEEAIYGNQS